jgi:HPt (histidine-containing phosphotransfer) domain-containing protein
MLTTEKLKEYGAEIEKALPRCGNNEALYLRLVGMCADDLRKDALGEALKDGDLDRAFDIAHKLKGAASNLALTPISDPVSELTELLRGKTPGDYEKLHAQIVLKTDELTELMK